MKLTTEYNLKDHGFVLVKNFYSVQEINSFEFTNLDMEYPFQDYLAKGAEINFDFSRVTKYANSLTNSDYHIFMQKVNYKPSFIGSHEIYHQDYYYRRNTGIDSNNFLQVFIALEDLNYAPLNVFIGSHKLGLLDHTMCLERNGKAKFRIVNEKLNKLKDTFKTIYMEKGDALFFNYKLVHGSPSNASPFEQPRAVIQLCTKTIDNIIHGSDRREFEVELLKKFLNAKL